MKCKITKNGEFQYFSAETGEGHIKSIKIISSLAKNQTGYFSHTSLEHFHYMKPPDQACECELSHLQDTCLKGKFLITQKVKK
jgi:hypothetical protein